MESFSVDSLMLQRHIAFRLPQEPLANDPALHLVALVPARGESLIRNVMASVGGSMGCAGSGMTHFRRADGVRHGCFRQPGNGDDIAGGSVLDAGPIEPAKGQHLGHAALLDQLAIPIDAP